MPDTAALGRRERRARVATIVGLLLCLVGCATERTASAQPASGEAALERIADGRAAGSPEDEGLDSRVLLAMTEWIRDRPVPIFFLLISRNKGSS